MYDVHTPEEFGKIKLLKLYYVQNNTTKNNVKYSILLNVHVMEEAGSFCNPQMELWTCKQKASNSFWDICYVSQLFLMIAFHF